MLAHFLLDKTPNSQHLFWWYQKPTNPAALHLPLLEPKLQHRATNQRDQSKAIVLTVKWKMEVLPIISTDRRRHHLPSRVSPSIYRLVLFPSQHHIIFVHHYRYGWIQEFSQGANAFKAMACMWGFTIRNLQIGVQTRPGGP